MLQLKEYQQRSLEALEQYFRAICRHGAKAAFVLAMERPYRDVPHMENMPYVCLRVPTGGGKTFMACHSLHIAAREFLQAERAVCLWLAPSNAIVNQTLEALKNRHHPYRQVLDAAFSGNIKILELTEALYVTRADLDGATCIIVTTLQALRVTDTEGRKVYESAGALQHHFSDLPPMIRSSLEKTTDGTIDYSLANVLSMRHPVVIMDEAHNARTPLSFDTLNRFNPSCIIEFTATPETKHDPQRGLFASNILHHVSALELKEAEMIKLPIRLRTRAAWQEIVSDAIQTHHMLTKEAEKEQKQSGEYIRPIMLLQAQSVTGNDINVDTLKQTLITEFHIPEEQIAIATGSQREIKGVDLFDPDCPIRFIITVKALAEGWDCSFAYILCSVSEISTARSVEQVLGRILRLPRAKKKENEALNCAYAFAASPNFIHTANSLRDALIEGAGFQKMEAADLIVPDKPQDLFDTGTLFVESSETLSEAPDLEDLPPDLSPRVAYNSESSTLTVRGLLSNEQKELLQQRCLSEQDRQAIERIYHASQGRVAAASGKVERVTLSVPRLGIRIDNQLELFEEDHFLAIPWNLAECDPSLTEKEFPSDYANGEAGQIDVTEDGHVQMTDYIREIHTQLSLFEYEKGWTLAELTNWIDGKIPHPDITQVQSSLFIHNVLTGLMDARKLEVEHLARHKFRLIQAIKEKIETYRLFHHHQAYQKILFESETEIIETSPELCLIYNPDHYAPNWYYEGGYQWKKHLFHLVGELKSDGEEFECALFLDSLDEVEIWVRNLERRVESSFWLQTSTDKFYPDFVCRLTDGRILVVEYKGADRWSNDDSKEKRALGELWSERSKDQCLFIMPKGPNFESIRQKIH
ncbi:MAG: DEAD/DEAH box helicase family protein [Sedimentisphaerales bacterium]|nr:DEAD/DEAH box helicase family protein [Sedimentisphaerales bacterium]